MNRDELVRAVWPLPGGNKHYLDTLVRMLQWVSSTEGPTRAKFGEWLMSEYNVGESTVSSYLRVATTLGVLDAQKDGGLRLTSLGKKILAAGPEDRARIVIDQYMTTFLAFPEVLAAYDRANKAIHLNEMVDAIQEQFPRWTSEAQYEYRALWLLSLGALEQEQGRYYKITDFGRAVAARHPANADYPAAEQAVDEPKAVPELTTEAVPSVTEMGEYLAEELERAAIDSSDPDHLEHVVAEAFAFLGFGVDELGGSGETDVLVRADIGPDRYVVVVDAKARHSGKLTELEPYTLQDHLTINEADYAVVVAGDFASGKVAHHAEKSGIVLLSVHVLAEWLRMHALTPFNLSEQRVMFTAPGLLTQVPEALRAAASRRSQWANLLVDTMELITETYGHGLVEPLSSENLFAMLVTRLQGVRYPKQQIVEAIKFLAHPAIAAALTDTDGGVALAMSRETLARSLRSLADQIESTRAETEA